MRPSGSRPVCNAELGGTEVAGNRAVADGAGIYQHGGVLSVLRSAVDGNRSWCCCRRRRTCRLRVAPRRRRRGRARNQSRKG
jgi:hypothetical protein